MARPRRRVAAPPPRGDGEAAWLRLGRAAAAWPRRRRVATARSLQRLGRVATVRSCEDGEAAWLRLGHGATAARPRRLSSTSLESLREIVRMAETSDGRRGVLPRRQTAGSERSRRQTAAVCGRDLRRPPVCGRDVRRPAVCGRDVRRPSASGREVRRPAVCCRDVRLPVLCGRDVRQLEADSLLSLEQCLLEILHYQAAYTWIAGRQFKVKNLIIYSRVVLGDRFLGGRAGR